MRFAVEPLPDVSLADRAAQRASADVIAVRRQEAEQLMEAGLAVMTRLGQERRATVAEIVREAGLSNQAFYRHFASKDDLVAALVDRGARRLVGYVAHHMDAEDDPATKLRVWVRRVLLQAADEKVARPTRAVDWNRSSLARDAEAAASQAERGVWALLVEPLRALGSPAPESDAYFVGKLVFAVLVELLWSDSPAPVDDLGRIEDFCLAAVGDSSAVSGRRPPGSPAPGRPRPRRP
jgi:AcrR family transcriptional regulator